MRLRRLSAMVASVMLATMVAGGASAQDASVLSVARLADHFNFWHPVQFQTGNQFQWWSTVFNTLVTVEADSKTMAPGLADTWEFSDDATEFTFHLNPDATWHDGTPVTAGDVAFTINWYANNSFKTPTGALTPSYEGFAPMWGSIAGFDDALGTVDADGITVIPSTVPVSGVEVVDDQTVTFTLGAPNAEFLVRIADMANVILPAHALADVDKNTVEASDFAKGTPGVTIGSGPYKLATFTPDQLVEVEANPDYFRGAPEIDRIVFKLFADPTLAIAQLESGDLDLAFRVPPGEFDRLDAIDTLDVIAADNPGVFRIVIATEKAPWSSVEARQAIAHAINKQAIVDSFYKGRAKVLSNHPGFTVYDDINPYAYDPAKAAELLAEAGYNGEPFRIIYDSTFPDANSIMPLIQADLTAAGIAAELVPTEGATAYVALFEDRTTWEGSIAIGGSEALSPDRSKQYYSADPAIQSGYTNPRIFELWAEGVSTTDAAARDAAYHELALLLNTDLPMVHLYAPSLVMAASTRLGGGFDIHLNERETFMDVETWTIEPAS